ncbi:hypothetical protein [Flammeovirga sp. OC4]|uniref:hypothetical protein n=1 Tax=Flammeovirga sp. OC4 TaxID=1382345 RepID=UPI0005C6BC6F|nr:hypothetical protein [Flammeovirga sp. OC4]
MSIFSNLYSSINTLKASTIFPFLFHDSIEKRGYPFEGNSAEFQSLIHSITVKYGMKVIRKRENEIQLLMVGSNVIPSSSFEGLMSSQCLIKIKRRVKEEELIISSFETLISVSDSEKKSFDRVIQCKLNTFMAYLHQENNTKRAN